MEQTRPELKGVIQSSNQKREKLGDIVLWPNESTNPRAPKYVGEMLTNHGTKYRVSLWDNRDKARQRVLDV